MKCPLRFGKTISVSGEECQDDCAWLMVDVSDSLQSACAVAVIAQNAGEQMCEQDKNSWCIANEVME